MCKTREQEQLKRESILGEEGLADIDEVEGFGDKVADTVRLTTDVNFQIDADGGEVKLFLKGGKLVGYVKKGYYTYGNVSSSEHLEKKVFDEYQGKGYGQLLFNKYKEQGFYIPQIETHHKPSAILFDLHNGYELTHYFDESGNMIELDIGRIASFKEELADLIKNGDCDLAYTYRMAK